MRKLYLILSDAKERLNAFFDAEGRPCPRGKAVVWTIKTGYKKLQGTLPDDVSKFFRRVSPRADVTLTWAFDEKFAVKRRIDGASMNFNGVWLLVSVSGTGRMVDAVDSAGLLEFRTSSYSINDNYLRSYAFMYLTPETHEALSKFLKEAGLNLEEYTPPWLEHGLLETVKPSERRPDREAGRFLGFW